MAKLHNEENLIRPSRSKNRSKISMLSILLERQESVRELGKELENAKTELHNFRSSAKQTILKLETQEKYVSQLIEDQEKRNQDHEKNLQDLVENIQKEETQIKFLSENLKCLEMEEEVKRRELEALQEKLKELRIYRSTVSEEGFEEVVSRFQDLNVAAESAVETYQQLLRKRELRYQRDFSQKAMTALHQLNLAEELEDKQRESSFYQLRKARQNNQHVAVVAGSTKQHTQLYLSIINLATQLSNHALSRKLLNITTKQSQPKIKKSLNQDKTAENSLDLSAKWRKVAMTALSEHRQTVNSKDAGIGENKLLEVKMVSPRKATMLQDQGKSPRLKITEERINTTAIQKLCLIEQVLEDLRTVAVEIQYHNDPFMYNIPQPSQTSY